MQVQLLLPAPNEHEMASKSWTESCIINTTSRKLKGAIFFNENNIGIFAVNDTEYTSQLRKSLIQRRLVLI